MSTTEASAPARTVVVRFRAMQRNGRQRSSVGTIIDDRNWTDEGTVLVEEPNGSYHIVHLDNVTEWIRR